MRKSVLGADVYEKGQEQPTKPQHMMCLSSTLVYSSVHHEENPIQVYLKKNTTKKKWKW